MVLNFGKKNVVKNFAEEYAKEKVVARRHLGVLDINLDRIVGSVGRWRDRFKQLTVLLGCVL